mgnify:CR=1 FL=1
MTRFDELINRKNTDSLKYDFAVQRGKPEDVIPLWVADMDFQAPPAVLEALARRSHHGIFGYSEPLADYFSALESWFARNHGWSIQEEWLVKTPGVVFAICTAIRAFTQKGDAVLIQQPVYYPFSSSVLRNERKLVVNQLAYESGRYTIDFDDFESKIVHHGVKLFILCNPHNPVGRVWSRKELERLGDICVRHGVIVIADEIHHDFVYPGHKHLVFSALKPEYAPITITCTAPTKTFNLAGLQISNIFIPDPTLRSAFSRAISRAGYSQLNTMGIVACRAAYANGQAWLDALRSYLLENLNFVRSFLLQRLPQIRLVEPEGTYLIWLDFRSLSLPESALDARIVNESKLWLDAGSMFGAGGEGFQRINIACPRSILEGALTRLAQTFG